MSGALHMLAGRLPPTATYVSREWRWLPAPAGGPLGYLTITLQRALRNGRSRPVVVESDTYAVDFEGEQIARMGNTFLLVNLSDAEQPDAYRVLIGPEVSCTCKAAKCRLSCKHVDAMIEVIEQGGIESPE